MKAMGEANRLKEESNRNAMMVRKQKEAEAQKNNSIKEMIRK